MQVSSKPAKAQEAPGCCQAPAQDLTLRGRELQVLQREAETHLPSFTFATGSVQPGALALGEGQLGSMTSVGVPALPDFQQQTLQVPEKGTLVAAMVTEPRDTDQGTFVCPYD